MDTSTILIVDDNAENLRVLKNVLDQPGRDVRAATSGPPALAVAQKMPIDLILLDINMPGMDGYEVCRRLKSHPATQDIPVIFLSANTETENIVQGFALGGADYITKPFEIAEVEARVNTHLQLSRLQRQLARHNEELEATVQARTSELREAHAKLFRLDAAKDDFFRLISHEVRTPLNGMVALEIALSDLGGDDPLEEPHQIFLKSFRSMVEIVDHALALVEFKGEAEGQSTETIRLGELIDVAHRSIASFAAENAVVLPPVKGDSTHRVRGEVRHYQLALREVLKAAILLTAPEQAVEVHLTDPLTVLVASHGRAFEAEELAGIFEIFGPRHALASTLDLGLGPCVANQVLNYLGVALTVDLGTPDGVQFRLQFKPAEAS